MSQYSEHANAGFFRRLFIIIYDLLVAVALFMVVGTLTFIVVLIMVHIGLIDGKGHKHFVDIISVAHPWLSKTMFAVNVLLVCHIFCWFWSHGGQTLGMRAWRTRIVSTDNNQVSMKQAWIRMLCALGGLGNLLALFDLRQHNSLQDKVAGTRMVQLSKEENIMRNWEM